MLRIAIAAHAANVAVGAAGLAPEPVVVDAAAVADAVVAGDPRSLAAPALRLRRPLLPDLTRGPHPGL